MAAESVSVQWTPSRHPSEVIPALWHGTLFCWKHPLEDGHKRKDLVSSKDVAFKWYSIGKCVPRT